jgi:hypothetical protein
MRLHRGTPLAEYVCEEHVMPSPQPYRVTALMTIVVIIGIAGLLEIHLSADGEESSGELIQRIIAESTRSSVAARAIRDLRAGTRAGKHVGWMQVETIISRSGEFSWKVIEEGGSERTRNKVFRQLLEAEAEAARTGRDDAALTRVNYDFGSAMRTRNGQLELRLVPRRQDPRLLDGTLTVSADGSPVLLQGQLAKSPSFWVKSVTVVKRFTKVGGVTLPAAVESLADLKMFGQASFTMQYRYSEVNGRPVSHSVAELPRFGPSAELLALHTVAQ